MRTFTPKNATLVPEHAKKVFEGIIYDVYQWEQEQFDGSSKTFEMIKRPDSIDIIAVHDGKILLSKEEQPHVGTFMALPAGMHDNDKEDELAAAKRELKEETGYTFKNWKLISAKQSGSNKIEQIHYVFLATDLIQIEDQDTDAGEKIEVLTLTLDELKSMKFDPLMQFYLWYIFDRIESLEELLALPSLHNYEN